MNWYLKVLKQYADFKGRARRKEFWMFNLFQMILAFLAMGIDSLIGFTFSPSFPYGFAYMVLLLVTLIPGIAVTVRRLHDIGKSGWFYFIALIPLAGVFILLYWLCQDSVEGSNKWGENPKGIGNDKSIDQIGVE